MIKKWISKLTEKVAYFRLSKPAIKLVYGVITIYLVLVFMFILGVVFNTMKLGNVDVRSIIEMVKVLLGPAAIAAIGFLGRAFFDSDNDGIPDAFDEIEQNTIKETKPGEGEKEC